MSWPGVHLEVEGTLQAVSKAVAELRQRLEGRLAPQDCDAIELGVAEVLTNIVLHGRDAGPIELECSSQDGVVEVLVRDTGLPIPLDQLAGAGPAGFDFDPADLDSLPDHGWGLALVRRLFHSLDYRRDDGHNEMRLRRMLS